MAKPQDTYPETATNQARKDATDTDGEAAIREALGNHGEELTAVVESTDELSDVLETAILIAASADDAEIEYVTESAANLTEAVDGLSTAEAAELAGAVGDNAGDLSETLETVVRLQRAGHLDDLVTLTTAFSESLSPAEVEELATMLESSGTDLVESFDVVLGLQREGHLEDLVGLGKTLSALEIEAETAEGLNDVLAAVGEARRESRPVGFLGLVRQLWSRDARAGLGYLVALLKALGRRTRK